jgi:hypothetical protein
LAEPHRTRGEVIRDLEWCRRPGEPWVSALHGGPDWFAGRHALRPLRSRLPGPLRWRWLNRWSAYDQDYGEEPHLTLVGKKGKQEVVVEVLGEP